jgi:hypothetical protein
MQENVKRQNYPSRQVSITTRKTYDAMEVQLFVFFTSALDGGTWCGQRAGERTLHPLTRRLGAPKGSFGHFREEEYENCVAC